MVFSITADPSRAAALPRERQSRLAWSVVAAVALAGLALRLAGGAGDLWLDEAWSFFLLRPVTSLDQIFWAINHDNNHFLNSIWLYVVGPDAPPLVARALSIALGTATVFAAALAARDGRATMIVTALLFAASYIMVHYGSEARGYAGLVLFTIAAVALTELALEGRPRPLAFGAVVLLGFLSHLTFAATVAVLVGWCSVAIWRRTRSARAVNAEVGAIFAPAFLAVLPLALCMLAGRALHGFDVGGVTAFTVDGFAAGLGGAFKHALGLPLWLPDGAVIGAVFAAVLVSSRWLPTPRSGLYLIGIVVLPAAMAAAHLPNVQYPRYFLVSATLLLLWLGEQLGRAIEAGGRRRVGAIAACAVFVAGNAAAIGMFLEHGRGTYRPIVDRIASSEDPRYGASHDTRVPILVDLMARGSPPKPQFVPHREFCAAPPLWFVQDGQRQMPQRLIPNPDCAAAYERVEAHSRWVMSGNDWALYRLVDP